MQFGFKGGGQFDGVAAGKYTSDGVTTGVEPETLRPDEVDMEAAAASQEGIKDLEPVESIAGGFGKQAIPFVDNLRVGDGRLAGDIGFDPLQLAADSKTLAWYREAEIKHSRLAMLAALGWPVAEKLNGPLSSSFGQDSLLVDGRAPTLANGGLGAVSIFYWVFALGLAVAAENAYLDDQLGVRKRTDYVPGMVGIDPLGMDGGGTRNAEIWAGRVAMLAVVVYALEEYFSKAPLLIAPGF
jgi:hypothetical protein